MINNIFICWYNFLKIIKESDILTNLNLENNSILLQFTELFSNYVYVLYWKLIIMDFKKRVLAESDHM